MKFKSDFSSRFRILKGGKISLMVSALLGSVTLSVASPTAGVVTSGTANISQSGNTTNINQSSNKATINWQDFSIKSNETVNFNQPNKNSITLNRVVGNEKSVIDGALNANGQVWILNSNGVLFNKTAKVNTAGIVATTKELSDADFNAGNYNFKGDSKASVINLGTIEVSNSGYVVLASNEVKNQGTIKAVKGKVYLSGADKYSLNLNGNSLVSLSVKKGVLDALVENSGTVIANGGEIYLSTNAVNELLKGVVNNTGILEANSLDGVTGKVELFAHGGEVQVGGTIKAKDGFVETSGKKFSIDKNTNIKAKTWLIDPTNLTVNDATAYETALGNGTDTLIKTDNA
ncbi:MAG: filamentous hemagglutinin N-terminal domain-containing protein, partial [Arcobacter sp.]